MVLTGEQSPIPTPRRSSLSGVAACTAISAPLDALTSDSGAVAAGSALAALWWQKNAAKTDWNTPGVSDDAPADYAHLHSALCVQIAATLCLSVADAAKRLRLVRNEIEGLVEVSWLRSMLQTTLDSIEGVARSPGQKIDAGCRLLS